MEDQAEKFRQQKKHNQLLLIGAARGYFKDVEALVELGAALDFKDKKGLTALHYAAGSGHRTVVHYLWSKGAEVDAEAPDGRTPLHLAALRGHPDCVSFLVGKGAWLEAEDSKDNTPLHLAASRGQVKAVEALLQLGAKTGGANKHGLTPLGAALVRGQTEAVGRLLSWGAAWPVQRPGSYSLLHLVAGRGHLEAVRMVLDRGADVNDASNPEATTPLHAAVLGGDAPCVEALLQAGADASTANAEGRLPVDLLPDEDGSKQAATIRELLAAASCAGAAGRGGKGGKGSGRKASPAPFKTPHQAFQELDPAGRRSKVELWLTLSEADVAAALSGYPDDVAAEVAQRVARVKSLRAMLNIQKAMAAAHADEEFQTDAAQPHVRQAVEVLRKDPSQYEQYAGDPLVLSVLGKMRRLHGVCQANGQRQVALEDMVVQPGSGFEKRDRDRLAALTSEVGAHMAATAAAAAAATGAAVEVAAAAYTDALEAARKVQLQLEEKRQGEAARPKPAKATSPQESVEASILQERMGKAPARARGASVPSGQAAEEAAARAIRELERRTAGEEDEDKLPVWMKGGFSWKKVGAEFLRQCAAAAVMMGIFLVVSWVVRGRPPWEGAQRSPVAGMQPGGDLIQDSLDSGADAGANAHVDL